MRVSGVQSRNSEMARLIGLFFIHGMALGMWFVPLSTLLPAYGLEAYKPYIYATGAISAFISPLIFGALADQRFAPATLLRWLSVASAVCLLFTSLAIEKGWGVTWILILFQLHALCVTPSWSLSTTLVLARLDNAAREFGPIRACGTFGWIVGCWVVSYVLQSDRSIITGYTAAAVWLLVAASTYMVPSVSPSAPTSKRSWKEALGLDAWRLLKNRNHCVVFVTAALYNISLAAFYPYTPLHLEALGFEKTSAIMTLGQVTEIIAMLGLAWVMGRFRIKTLFLAGIGFGAFRYALCMLDNQPSLLIGIALHGFAFTLFFITVPIYLDREVATHYRARAQALFTLMFGGFGNLFGYLGSGWFFAKTTTGNHTNWQYFWGGMSAIAALVFVIFALTFRERASDKPINEL